MGQQQLLLLVLGIVIVGLAVVVGIQAFGENQKKANSDAITNDAIRIASDAQAWKLKPTAFGGPAATVTGAANFTGVSFPTLGYTVLATAQTAPFACPIGSYTNLNGCYTLGVATTGLTITGENPTNKNQVITTVTGTTPALISTEVKNL